MFKRHPALRYLLAALLGVLALWLAFRKQDFGELMANLASANIAIILAGTGVMFLSHLVRAWRYKMFMRPIQKVSVNSSFRALIAGYAMNNVIPRSGDVVRPVIMSKREDMEVPTALAALLIERLSDLIGLSVVVILTLIIFKDQIAIGFPAISAASIPIMIGMVLLLSFGLMILLSEAKAAKVLGFVTKILPKKFQDKVQRGVLAFEEGLKETRGSAAFPLLAGTFGIWFLYSVSMFVSLHAFQSSILHAVGLRGCVMLQTLSGLAFTIPTPGGVGTYHYFISQSLHDVFSVPLGTAVAYATLTHASNYLITTIIGMIFMFHEGISFREVKDAAKTKQPLKTLTEEERQKELAKAEG